jgi:hypothetical protein
MEKHSIFSQSGRLLLKSYVKYYKTHNNSVQSGGMKVEINEEMFKQAFNFGSNACIINAFEWLGISRDIIDRIFKVYIKNEHEESISDYELIKVIFEYIDNLRQDTHPEHSRIKSDMGQVELLKYDRADSDYKSIMTMVKNVLDHLDNKEAMFIVVYEHLTVIGKDVKGIPFIVDLQPNNPETSKTKCEHIPYGFPKIIDYFVDIETAFVFDKGVKLKPKLHISPIHTMVDKYSLVQGPQSAAPASHDSDILAPPLIRTHSKGQIMHPERAKVLYSQIQLNSEQTSEDDIENIDSYIRFYDYLKRIFSNKSYEQELDQTFKLFIENKIVTPKLLHESIRNRQTLPYIKNRDIINALVMRAVGAQYKYRKSQ